MNALIAETILLARQCVPRPKLSANGALGGGAGGRLAVGYCRVSTVKQEVSLEAQRAKIEQWAQVNGVQLLDVLDDSISGKTLEKRPKVLDAIEMARKHKAALVVYSLSRFSRSTVDTLKTIDELRHQEIPFVSLTEQIDTSTPMGRTFYGMVALFAQMERELIVERTAMALAHKRRQGEALGSIPYGFRKVGLARSGRTADQKEIAAPMLEPVEREMQGLNLMLALRTRGNSYAEIARQMTESGYPTRANGGGAGGWDRGSVRRIVEYYATTGLPVLEKFIEPRSQS